MANPYSRKIEGLEMFCGGGVATCGIRAAGVSTVAAIEYDADTCAVYADNFGPHVLCSPVEDVDYKPYAGVDFAWASPVCKSFSVAKAGREELQIDLSAATAVCRMLREVRPPAFVLENVRGYQKSKAFALIRQTLGELGFWWHEDILNSADFGVPQTRLRLIVRACLGAFPAPLPPPTRRVGWYEAIEDLIPELPSSAFAPWQLARLEAQMAGMTRAFLMGVQGEGGDGLNYAEEPAQVITSAHGAGKYRSFIVEGTAAGTDNKFNLPTREAQEPIFTANNTHHPLRGWLEEGRVVAMTPRALARLMGMPDSYQLPATRKLATQIIGNGCPSLLAEAVTRSVLEGIR